MRFRRSFAPYAVALLAAGLAMLPATPAEAGPAVLVVPARYRMLQLGFDLQRLTRASLVSYQKAAGSQELLLHRWTGENWQPLALDAYTSGRFAGAQGADAVIVVGDAAAGALELVGGTTWNRTVAHVDSMQISEIVQNLYAMRRLSNREVSWLAGRYGLQVEDLNWERRRYGRYGPPGQSVAPPAAPRERRTEYLPPPVEPVVEVAPAPVPPPARPEPVARPAPPSAAVTPPPPPPPAPAPRTPARVVRTEPTIEKAVPAVEPLPVPLLEMEPETEATVEAVAPVPADK